MIRVRAEIVKRDLCRLHGGEVIKEEKGFDFPTNCIIKNNNKTRFNSH